MEIFDFVRRIINKNIIQINNYGKHYRDFTHIHYVSETIFSLLEKSIKRKKPFFDIFNIGSSKPIKIMKVVNLMEDILKLKAKIKYSRKQKVMLMAAIQIQKEYKILVKLKIKLVLNQVY